MKYRSMPVAVEKSRSVSGASQYVLLARTHMLTSSRMMTSMLVMTQAAVSSVAGMCGAMRKVMVAVAPRAAASQVSTLVR